MGPFAQPALHFTLQLLLTDTDPRQPAGSPGRTHLSCRRRRRPDSRLPQLGPTLPANWPGRTQLCHRSRPLGPPAKHLSSVQQALGEEHLRTLSTSEGLAILYKDRGRHQEAEPLYTQVLEIRKRVQGPNHPTTLRSMKNLAQYYLEQGRYDDAEPLNLEVLEIRKRVLGDKHPDTLFAMMNLANLYREEGRLAEASDVEAQAVAAARRVWPEGSWFIGSFLGEHGLTLIKMQRYGEAEAALIEAREILAAAMGTNSARTSGVMEVLTELYDAWHETEPDKGYDAKAAEWKSKLGSANEAAAQGAPDSDPE